MDQSDATSALWVQTESATLGNNLTDIWEHSVAPSLLQDKFSQSGFSIKKYESTYLVQTEKNSLCKSV